MVSSKQYLSVISNNFGFVSFNKINFSCKVWYSFLYDKEYKSNNVSYNFPVLKNKDMTKFIKSSFSSLKNE